MFRSFSRLFVFSIELPSIRPSFGKYPIGKLKKKVENYFAAKKRGECKLILSRRDMRFIRVFFFPSLEARAFLSSSFYAFISFPRDVYAFLEVWLRRKQHQPLRWNVGAREKREK